MLVRCMHNGGLADGHGEGTHAVEDESWDVELPAHCERPPEEEVGDDEDGEVPEVGELTEEAVEGAAELPCGPEEGDVEVHGGEPVGVFAAFRETVDDGEVELMEEDVGVVGDGLEDEGGVCRGGEDGDSESSA